MTGDPGCVPEVVQRIVYHRLLNEQERKPERNDERNTNSRLRRRAFDSSVFDATANGVVDSRHDKLNLNINKLDCKTFE